MGEESANLPRAAAQIEDDAVRVEPIAGSLEDLDVERQPFEVGAERRLVVLGHGVICGADHPGIERISSDEHMHNVQPWTCARNAGSTTSWTTPRRRPLRSSAASPN